MYFGGIEHVVMHHLYARFITMVLHDLGHLPFEEPFTRLRLHGFVTKDGAKMSKSRGNVVNPDEYIGRVGADAFRMYLLFMGPFDQDNDFSDLNLTGVTRYLDRVWRMVTGADVAAGDGVDMRPMHRFIKRVTEELQPVSVPHRHRRADGVRQLDRREPRRPSHRSSGTRRCGGWC